MSEQKDEYMEGFRAGYKFCEDISNGSIPKGSVVPFFPPDKMGVFRNGFAEGTITGGHKFNVSWRWVKTGENLVEI